MEKTFKVVKSKEHLMPNALEDLLSKVRDWDNDWRRYDKENKNKPISIVPFMQKLAEEFVVGYVKKS